MEAVVGGSAALRPLSHNMLAETSDHVLFGYGKVSADNIVFLVICFCVYFLKCCKLYPHGKCGELL